MADKTELEILLSMVDKTSGPMGKVGKGLMKLGKLATKAGKVMTKNLTMPIVGLGALSVRSFAKFEGGMANVATLVDTSTESMADMSDQVREIGKNTPVSLDELTQGLYDVRSAGIPAADAMNVLEKSSQLAVAGLSTTAEATNAVTSSINAFKLEGAEADGVYDVLFTAVKHGKTDLSQLGKGFGAVAGKMADAGIEFDEYIAGVSAMTTVGLPAAQAHTQMRAALDGLTKGGKKTSKVMHALGAKDFRELIKQSGGVVPAMKKVREHLGGSEAKMRDLIGSSEGSAAAMSVTGTTYQAFTETLADMRDGVSEVEKGFEKQNKTTSAQWKKTKNQLESVAITIGAKLAPFLEKAAQKVQELFEWFDSLNDGTKDTILQVVGIVAVVGPALLIFGKLAGALGAISKAFGVLQAVLVANPLFAALALLAAAALLIYKNWEDFEQFFKLIWDGVKQIFADASDFITEKIEDIMGAIDTVKDEAGAHFGIRSSKREKKAQLAKNKRIMDEFRARTGSTHVLAGERKAGTNTLSGEAQKQLQRNAIAASRGQGIAQANKKETNEIIIKIEGNATVKSKKGPANVDVKTGMQGAL